MMLFSGSSIILDQIFFPPCAMKQKKNDCHWMTRLIICTGGFKHIKLYCLTSWINIFSDFNNVYQKKIMHDRLPCLAISVHFSRRFKDYKDMRTKSFSTCETKEKKKQLSINDKTNHVHKRLQEHQAAVFNKVNKYLSRFTNFTKTVTSCIDI